MNLQLIFIYARVNPLYQLPFKIIMHNVYGCYRYCACCQPSDLILKIANNIGLRYFQCLKKNGTLDHAFHILLYWSHCYHIILLHDGIFQTFLCVQWKVHYQTKLLIKPIHNFTWVDMGQYCKWIHFTFLMIFTNIFLTIYMMHVPVRIDGIYPFSITTK